MDTWDWDSPTTKAQEPNPFDDMDTWDLDSSTTKNQEPNPFDDMDTWDWDSPTTKAQEPNPFDYTDDIELNSPQNEYHTRTKLSYAERLKAAISAQKDYNFDKDTRTRIKKQNLGVEDLPYVEKLIEAGTSPQYATNPNIIDLCKSGFEIKKYYVGEGNKGYDILCFTKEQFDIALSTKTNYGLSDNLCIEAANYKLNDNQIRILSEAQKLGLSEDLCIQAAHQNVEVENLQYVKTCDIKNYKIDAYDAAKPAVVLMRKLGYTDGFMLKEGTTFSEAQTKIIQEAFNKGLNEVYVDSGNPKYYGEILCVEAAKAGISLEQLPKLKEFVQTKYTQAVPDLAVKHFKTWVETGYQYY